LLSISDKILNCFVRTNKWSSKINNKINHFQERFKISWNFYLLALFLPYSSILIFRSIFEVDYFLRNYLDTNPLFFLLFLKFWLEIYPSSKILQSFKIDVFFIFDRSRGIKPSSLIESILHLKYPSLFLASLKEFGSLPTISFYLLTDWEAIAGSVITFLEFKEIFDETVDRILLYANFSFWIV